MDGFSIPQVNFSPKKKRRRHLFRLSDWRDWPGLPQHLLLDIANKLTVIDHYVVFGRVCVSWRSVFLEKMKNLGSPLLLSAPPQGDSSYFDGMDVYSLSTKRVYSFQTQQLAHNKFCCGSSFGWLVTIEEKGVEQNRVRLQNPFLNRTIDLPPLDNIARLHVDMYGGCEGYVFKAALSSDPLLSNDYIVMGIMSRYHGLAFFKSGDKDWSSIRNHWILDWNKLFYFIDVIYFSNARRFYALLAKGAVVSIKFQGDKQAPKLKKVAPPPPGGGMEMYLVEDSSSGDLLQIHQTVCHTEECYYGRKVFSIKFDVFKFDPTKRNWIKLLTLGDKVLFLGSNCSMLRLALDCPGCMPNCIYYTSNLRWAKSYELPYSGIYNLEDGVILPYSLSGESAKNLPPTIWLEPTVARTPGGVLTT